MRKVIYPASFISLAVLFPAVAGAADDTFSCLSKSGPTVTINKNFGYTKYQNTTFADNTKFVAGNSTWKTEQQPNKRNLYPIILYNGRNACWTGGIVEGTSPYDILWGELYGVGGSDGGNSAAMAIRDAKNFVVDGFRTHNVWDPIRIERGADDFRIQNVWISHNRDDCVENDAGRTGVIDDSLFDGCYAGVSANVGSNDLPRSETVRIQNSLMRLEPMPGHVGQGIGLPLAHFGFFKWDIQNKDVTKYGPMLEIHNNLFMAEQPAQVSKANQWWALGLPGGRVRSCSGNVLVWLGTGEWKDFPGDWLLDEFPNCLKIVKGDAGRKLWNAARLNWINCHPKVPRFPGDPQSDPSKCDPNAWGGGGTGTPSGGTTGPGPCHLLTSSQSVPQGFGAAYNLFSTAKELLLNVECGATSNATLTVGNNQNTTYIYRLGYEWLDGRWKQISFGGQKLVANDWYVGNASANLFRSETQLAQDNFVVAYTCHWINNAWKCGCRDQSCTTNHWQLQAFRK